MGIGCLSFCNSPELCTKQIMDMGATHGEVRPERPARGAASSQLLLAKGLGFGGGQVAMSALGSSRVGAGGGGVNKGILPQLAVARSTTKTPLPSINDIGSIAQGAAKRLILSYRDRYSPRNTGYTVTAHHCSPQTSAECCLEFALRGLSSLGATWILFLKLS